MTFSTIQKGILQVIYFKNRSVTLAPGGPSYVDWFKILSPNPVRWKTRIEIYTGYKYTTQAIKYYISTEENFNNLEFAASVVFLKTIGESWRNLEIIFE